MDLGEVGIVWANLAMDLNGLPPDLVGHAPIMGRLMVQGWGAGAVGMLHADVWNQTGQPPAWCCAADALASGKTICSSACPICSHRSSRQTLSG